MTDSSPVSENCRYSGEKHTAPRRIHVTTLGCRLNQYDSESILTQFHERGYEAVENPVLADVCVINTCAVTSTAERKSRNLIRSLKRRNPRARIIAAGCFPERSAEAVAELGAADLIIGNGEKEHVLDFLDKLDAGVESTVFIGESKRAKVWTDGTRVRGLRSRARAFLKVQDGCSQKCTYCIVPQLRGPGRNLGLDDAVKRAEYLVDSGFSEIVLTGIALGTYGQDSQGAASLSQLLVKLEGITGLQRIRLGSIEPWAVTEELLDLIADSVKICPHLHLPVQSGSDAILRRMNRRYTVDRLRRLFHYALERRNDWGFGADIIAGFPGEDESCFQETCEFVCGSPLTYLHVFPFSSRPGTPAERLPDPVAEIEKRNRVELLLELDREFRLRFQRRHLGTVQEVLIEKHVNGFSAGLTPNYLRVYTSDPGIAVKSFIRTRITDIRQDGVVGTAEQEDEKSRKAECEY